MHQHCTGWVCQVVCICLGFESTPAARCEIILCAGAMAPSAALRLQGRSLLACGPRQYCGPWIVSCMLDSLAQGHAVHTPVACQSLA